MFKLLEKARNFLDRDLHKSIRFLIERFSSVLDKEWAMDIANDNVVSKEEIESLNISVEDFIVVGYIICFCQSLDNLENDSAEAYCNIIEKHNESVANSLRRMIFPF